MRENYEQLITEARQTSQDHEVFLRELLENEYRRRMENGQNRRIRYAKFPIKKYLCDFDRTKYDVYDNLKTVQKNEHSNLKLVHLNWTKKQFVIKFKGCIGD